jgi:Phage integrase family
MLRIDLAAAEIPYQDEAGRVFDFHSLRHQFVSNLALAGVHPKEAQALARHSTISLTMDRYTHLGILDLTAALERLPTIPDATNETDAIAQAATGTYAPGNRLAEVPPVVPSGAENGAIRLASPAAQTAPSCTQPDARRLKSRTSGNAKNSVESGTNCAKLHAAAPIGAKRRARDSNPQPVSRHLISSQAADHSLTLRANR